MKRYTLGCKLLMLFGIVLCMRGIGGHWYISQFPEPGFGTYLTSIYGQQEAVAFFCCFFGLIVCIASIALEQGRRKDFEKIFGHDPRARKWQPGEGEGDPQEVVSRRIENRRLRAQELFKREAELHERVGTNPEGVERELKILVRDKLEAKREFWEACRVARPWGYRVPQSINEPALILETVGA